jgi:LuxR family transcriptional regulator, maltose regulon positive regulatory protein
VGAGWGRVLADEGDLEAAREELERALAMRDAYPQMSPLPTLSILVELISTKIGLGENEEARELVERATTMLEFHGDVGILSKRIHGLQRNLGAPSQRPDLYGETLTEREISVLRMLATPLSHREIGSALLISLNTVKSHVRSIYRKLIVSSRSEAVSKGTELGFL